jgi:plastocyanin
MKRLLVVAVVVAALGACSSSKKAETPTTAPPVDLRGKSAVEVVAANNLFTPTSIIVTAGTKVTWRNTDAIVHNVAKSADILDFGGKFGVQVTDFGPGASYSFTFTKPGRFPYTCTIHTGMNGVVTVEELV